MRHIPLYIPQTVSILRPGDWSPLSQEAADDVFVVDTRAADELCALSQGGSEGGARAWHVDALSAVFACVAWVSAPGRLKPLSTILCVGEMAGLTAVFAIKRGFAHALALEAPVGDTRAAAKDNERLGGLARLNGVREPRALDVGPLDVHGYFDCVVMVDSDALEACVVRHLARRVDTDAHACFVNKKEAKDQEKKFFDACDGFNSVHVLDSLGVSCSAKIYQRECG